MGFASPFAKHVVQNFIERLVAHRHLAALQKAYGRVPVARAQRQVHKFFTACNIFCEFA